MQTTDSDQSGASRGAPPATRPPGDRFPPFRALFAVAGLAELVEVGTFLLIAGTAVWTIGRTLRGPWLLPAAAAALGAALIVLSLWSRSRRGARPRRER